MYRHILVPLITEADAPAARHAFTLSRLLGGRVTLLLLLTPPTDDFGVAVPPELLARLAGEARRPPALATLQPAGRDAAEAIAQYARKHAADLILMAAVDGTGVRQSLAHAVATRAGVPVKLVPATPVREVVPDRWRAAVADD